MPQWRTNALHEWFQKKERPPQEEDPPLEEASVATTPTTTVSPYSHFPPHPSKTTPLHRWWTHTTAAVQHYHASVQNSIQNSFPVIQIMGGCFSSKSENYIPDAAGDEEAFHSRYLEDRLLGEGEFGQVKLCHDMRDSNGTGEPLAVKILRKGMVFKDNTLYAPLKPQALQAECQILKTLAGNHYCLGLLNIYETPKLIYVVTELCSGGEMMEYVAKQEELRTEDVSRIAFQLLSAVNHCASHKVIHRDIKPENCMFRYPTAGAELRLIDFGSGTMDSPQQVEKEEQTQAMLQHTTFAGSAFYISPEMFQRTYTSKTDVWSAGVTLYVLVAGYPAEELQKAFNILQKSKNRNLKDLPNLPEDMPESYYDMLEGLLTYRHKARKSAGSMLTHEFVQFYKEHEANGLDLADVAAQAAASSEPAGGSTKGSRKTGRTSSIRLGSSVQRHTLFLDYQKFERAVTTLLATCLNSEEFEMLLEKLQHTLDRSDSSPGEELEVSANGGGGVNIMSNTQKLKIIPMQQLKQVLKDMQQERCVEMINKLHNAKGYETFAYHVALLKQFSRKREDNPRGGMKRSTSITSNATDGSNHGYSNSVHGNDVYGRLMANNKSKKSGRSASGGQRRSQSVVLRRPNALDGSRNSNLDGSRHKPLDF